MELDGKRWRFADLNVQVLDDPTECLFGFGWIPLRLKERREREGGGTRTNRRSSLLPLDCKTTTVLFRSFPKIFFLRPNLRNTLKENTAVVFFGVLLQLFSHTSAHVAHVRRRTKKARCHRPSSVALALHPRAVPHSDGAEGLSDGLQPTCDGLHRCSSVFF